MSFGARLAIVAAVAVALAVVTASAVVYVVVRGQLLGQVDDALRTRARELTEIPGPGLRIVDDKLHDVPGPRFGAAPEYIQAVPASGAPILTPDEAVPLPTTGSVRRAAEGRGEAFFSEARVSDTDFRVFTVPGSPYALQIARPLNEVNHTLDRITLLLALIAGGGIAVAAALGLVVSRAALAPVRRLTAATENVTATGDLSERIDARGQDELSRLAVSFNTMLGALEQSTRAQRQLVADASHELRTPLTSLRTNIEVLAGGRSLPEGERERLLSDVLEQLSEMTSLIAELIELARAGEVPMEPESVRLDLVVADAVERAQRNRPEVRFALQAQETTVQGVPDSIERAVVNLLDNAGKWSPNGAEVEVRVRDGEVQVRDHGPGIDEADLPRIFDRFYRAPAARGRPGSGLGLAIVRQVAESHGGEVVAERAEGGGTRMRLSLSNNS